MRAKEQKLEWRVHTPNLFKEILLNPQCVVLTHPIQILGSILADVAQRAIELDDPRMNELMMRLTLYSAADPESPDYNDKLVRKFLNKTKASQPQKQEGGGKE